MNDIGNVLINVAYFDDLEHVDLISIPPKYAVDLHKIGQDFFKWIGREKNHPFWVNLHGRKTLNADADALVWWINHILENNKGNAYVVKGDCKYYPEYPIIWF